MYINVFFEFLGSPNSINNNLTTTFSNSKENYGLKLNLNNTDDQQNTKNQLIWQFQYIWSRLANNSTEDVAQFAILALLKEKLDPNNVITSIIEGINQY